jgi:hypothetical protein
VTGLCFLLTWNLPRSWDRLDPTEFRKADSVSVSMWNLLRSGERDYFFLLGRTDLVPPEYEDRIQCPKRRELNKKQDRIQCPKRCELNKKQDGG